MAALLSEMSAAWPSSQRDKRIARTAESYFSHLADLPAAAVRRGVDAAIKTLEFFPKVAQLRKLAIEAVGEMRQTDGHLRPSHEGWIERGGYDDQGNAVPCPVSGCGAKYELRSRPYGPRRSTGELDEAGRPIARRAVMSAPYIEHNVAAHQAARVPVIGNYFGSGRPYFCEACQQDTGGSSCGGCGRRRPIVADTTADQTRGAA